MESSGSHSFSLMKKLITLVLVFLISFFWGMFFAKFFIQKRSFRKGIMAQIRIKRLKAINKALREGRENYEFEVGFVPSLSQ